MNPRIAVLRASFTRIGTTSDRPAATIPDFDETGTYRLLQIGDFEDAEWVRERWNGPRDYQLALD